MGCGGPGGRVVCVFNNNNDNNHNHNKNNNNNSFLHALKRIKGAATVHSPHRVLCSDCEKHLAVGCLEQWLCCVPDSRRSAISRSGTLPISFGFASVARAPGRGSS